MEAGPVYFVEHLGVRSFWRDVRPVLSSTASSGGRVVYFFDGPAVARSVLEKAGRWTFQRMAFELYAVKDSHGQSLWTKLFYRDLRCLRDQIRANPVFQKAIRQRDSTCFAAFLAKRVMDLGSETHNLLLRQMFMMAMIRRQVPADREVYFFVRERPWWKELQAHAACERIILRPVRDEDRFLPMEWRLLKEGGKRIQWGARCLVSGWKGLWKDSSQKMDSPPAKKGRLAVEYYGQLNVHHPDRFSDIFFGQESSLEWTDLLLYSNLSARPVTEAQYTEMEKCGLSCVAVNYRATVTGRCPVFAPPALRRSGGPYRHKRDSRNRAWIRSQGQTYEQLRAYWRRFFDRYDIRMHVSWYGKFDPNYFPLLEALRDRGGIGVLYQRSFEEFSHPWKDVFTDVLFSFSRVGASCDGHSSVAYHVITGYLGDHRFALLRSQAEGVRRKLMAAGAKRIVAYFDECASQDARWGISCRCLQEDYIFLLEKVLRLPWLGIVFKPKLAAKLRRRLGAVNELLRKAEQTGRCIVIEVGNFCSAYPPALAAMAADVAVQSHLLAGTAAVESALAGVPTLLLDREGVPGSLFYRLGTGKGVFHSWEDLWKACEEIWQMGGDFRKQVDWTDLLPELDPFRDGRAAQRMGEYVRDLLTGLREGRSREDVLAEAAERYVQRWGQDKVWTGGRDAPKMTKGDTTCTNGQA